MDNNQKKVESMISEDIIEHSQEYRDEVAKRTFEEWPEWKKRIFYANYSIKVKLENKS